MRLDEILQALDVLPATERAQIEKMALEATIDQRFIPNPGPQTDAWFCDADETFYGGSAGGGKTALLCGLAIDEYQPALILRRQATQVKGIEDELSRILGTRDGYNSQTHIWRLPSGGTIELGGVPNESDKEKYQGRPHRLKGFDEITQFTESQYRYIIGWLRDAHGRRCRVVATGNPPTSAQGQWVVKYWAPWLDPQHPNPAKPGELRWFTTIEGEDVEVGEDYVGPKGERPRSRTFIRSRLEDNPDLMATGYASTLEALPKELRDRLRDGSFDVEGDDDPWQVIPTKWVKLAQARWTDRPPEDIPMTAVAADVAQGGADKTQIQTRHDWWYSRFDSHKGSDTPDGPTVAGLIIKQMRDRCRVVVDAGGGYGGDTLTQLAHADVDCYGFKGGNASASHTRDGMFGFKNLRAQVVWQFREQLDPDYGSKIALPPDPELTADLCAFRYEIRAGGGGEEIVVLPKEEMREMLGRSPDKGDTTVMLSASKLGGLKRPKAAQERRDAAFRRVQSVTSNSALKARLRGKK
ncbi:Terminase-like family protein [Rhizobium mongolense subsp. loessense]|uniref:Terminase-like family protein n=1 Tax=Rhizobium mongolense subsp. loessense TaxID=158890 RepID=A0A1G4Q472_9HYPH|nr:terminase family protein [Rhizobium mongolense]SCW39148.1 Terminase-like family protein [Rhizobium mongolense subsp. loessense]